MIINELNSPLGGSDRSQETMSAKIRSFTKLAGDPTKGVQGGVMVHALRSRCIPALLLHLAIPPSFARLT
jgi:hypothetical protein